MIADMISNKTLNEIVAELFIKGWKLNTYIVFITQSYFAIPKDVTLNYTNFFLCKIPNILEFQQIVLNHSLDMDSKPYSFLVFDTTLASDNVLRFRKNLLEKMLKQIMIIDDKIRDYKITKWN